MTSERTVIGEVQILEVARNPDALAVLKDFSIDLPKPSTSCAGYVIEVAGWAVGLSADVRAVDVCCDGVTLSTASLHVPRPDVPAAMPHLAAGPTAGFSAIVALPGLPLDFRIDVFVHLADGRSVGVGHIVGRRSRALPPTPHTETSSPGLLTSADGRLPAVLAHTEAPVDETISPDDAMADGDVDGYLAVGESALKAIRLALLAARAPSPAHVLDFACGHGRVMRWLRAAFPRARLAGADIRTDGVDFCAQTFAATGVHCSLVPRPELFGERYDLIWVGSLFTHLDPPRWWEYLDLLHELLAPGGVLVMTTHGELVVERMRRGLHYGYPEAAVATALADYDRTGFAFMPGDDGVLGSYGLSLSRPSWVVAAVLRHDDLRIVTFTEGLWANHHDVVAVIRRPVDLIAAQRPYT